MSDYERIKQLIERLAQDPDASFSLSELSEYAGLSESHLHRLFHRWAGITPKKFQQWLRSERAFSYLRNGASVLDATLNAGLTSPGRLHELAIQLEAATPGEVKEQGHNWTLRIGFASSPFGDALIAVSDRGISHLSFVDERLHANAEIRIRNDWPHARLEWCPAIAEDWAAKIFYPSPRQNTAPTPIRAFIRGSKFQLIVWRALLKIPHGDLRAYGDIAATIDRPLASRAVGNAVGANSLGYLIPCHRVIRRCGNVGNYRWDPSRKRVMLLWESLSQE